MPTRMSTKRCQSTLLFPLLFGCALMISGCPMQRARPSIAWATAAQVRPTPPARSLTQEQESTDPAPDLRLDPPAVSALSVERSLPAKPRSVATSSGQNGSSSKREPPVIVPELTMQESTAFQQQTSQSLTQAESNLAAANGRSLNATQADLASKVRSFIADAREAARNGDWSRARNLARKAQSLSEELARSL